MIKPSLRGTARRLAAGTVDRGVAVRTDQVRFALGELHCAQAAAGPEPRRLRDAAFKVFSQWGEDGIIQFLVRRLDPPDTFVEIGVASYEESNTRFLAMKDNWRGAIFNGGSAHVEFLRDSGLAWQHAIDAVSAFVTRENVNELVTGTGIRGEIGLLSIDVDGVDYWLWNAIDVVDPWIVVVEFNSVFGPSLPVTVPYDPAFVSTSAHPSGQYFGASLAALHHVARRKGYRLVGVTTEGVNAFFVRDDVADGLWDLSPADAYVRSRLRTVRDATGALTYTGDDHARVLASMAGLDLVRADTGERQSIGELYGV